jgi:hypothetical protein
MSVKNRRLRQFVFGKTRRKRRGHANIPAHCKKGLSSCMKGGGAKSRAGACMRKFWTCRRAA